MEVTEHAARIYGLDVAWRSAPTPPGEAPVLYVHGVPTSSLDWVAFLRRTGGLAPDLPGFGRSEKPRHWDYWIDGYADFLQGFLDELEVDRLRLVLHDWGAVGLALAQRAPERIERLVIVDAVPLLPGYRWHWLARAWRTPVVGEFAMGFTTKRTLRALSRRANATPGPLPPELLGPAWEHFDQGTQRAILKLYRSAPPAELARAGGRLGDLDAPTLVVWGERDPYVPAGFADVYAARLPNARVQRVPGAGHWPWLDRPELIERIAGFLETTG